jgi:hypothetical protein
MHQPFGRNAMKRIFAYVGDVAVVILGALAIVAPVEAEVA